MAETGLRFVGELGGGDSGVWSGSCGVGVVELELWSWSCGVGSRGGS